MVIIWSLYGYYTLYIIGYYKIKKIYNRFSHLLMLKSYELLNKIEYYNHLLY